MNDSLLPPRPESNAIFPFRGKARQKQASSWLHASQEIETLRKATDDFR